MASVHNKIHYPCQRGKVFGNKDIRLRHQRTCPTVSDQTLNPYNLAPTCPVSANTHLLLVRSQLARWNGYEQDLWPTFSCTRQHANRGSYLEWQDRHGCPNWDRMQSLIFKVTLETVIVFVKPCTLTAPPGKLCSQECNKTWVLSFTQEYQPSLKKCFPQNNVLLTPTKWWIYSLRRLISSIS